MGKTTLTHQSLFIDMTDDVVMLKSDPHQYFRTLG